MSESYISNAVSRCCSLAARNSSFFSHKESTLATRTLVGSVLHRFDCNPLLKATPGWEMMLALARLNLYFIPPSHAILDILLWQNCRQQDWSGSFPEANQLHQLVGNGALRSRHRMFRRMPGKCQWNKACALAGAARHCPCQQSGFAQCPVVLHGRGWQLVQLPAFSTCWVVELQHLWRMLGGSDHTARRFPSAPESWFRAESLADRRNPKWRLWYGMWVLCSQPHTPVLRGQGKVTLHCFICRCLHEMTSAETHYGSPLAMFPKTEFKLTLQPFLFPWYRSQTQGLVAVCWAPWSLWNLSNLGYSMILW